MLLNSLGVSHHFHSSLRGVPKIPHSIKKVVKGTLDASAVLKFMTPFSAEEPYWTDDAPLIISTCERFSKGRKFDRRKVY